MNKDKSSLRLRYKNIRLNMEQDEVEAKSRLICQKLFEEIDGSRFNTICVYRPIARLNEVDVSPFVNQLISTYPDRIHLLSSAKAGRAPQEKFDLILVPVLAFDKYNYRLGWGGGFYDRFLAGQPGAIKIGLCFHNGLVVGGLPHEPHDIRLDKIITEL